MSTINTLYRNGLSASIISLRQTLARALADANIACQDLEDQQLGAAVGAVIPIRQGLHDASALLDSILILNRNLQGGGRS